jgi:hypothetical protein
MTQKHICHSRTMRTFGYFSFASGFVPSPAPRMKTEADVLAHALWLERYCSEDEAWLFIERHCANK